MIKPLPCFPEKLPQAIQPRSLAAWEQKVKEEREDKAAGAGKRTQTPVSALNREETAESDASGKYKSLARTA